MGRKKSQPWGIVLTTLLLAIAGLVMVVAGGTSMTTVQTTATGTVPATETITDPTMLLSYMPVPSVLASMSIPLIIMGLLFFAFAYLIWQHNEIGWYGTAIFTTISLFLNVVWALFYGAVVASPMLIGLVLCTIILLALFHKSTIKAINPDIDYNGWSAKSISN